ncbi:hypothetical protein DFP72DRAFT_1064888 [Ephemerocybe angulata]|uniref:Uncharacterized protein n=1 Tax=Ephemerocybe angulata TaxID=980116 RepID=A0A8H6MBL3_9AGAR|nr:hypothetical protein DFP72DRAFT_1064888 [Tulosesus angulatus]
MATTSRETDLTDDFSGDNLLRLRGILNNLDKHPGFYESHQDRLAASDIAFFAHGASLDDKPYNENEFHPAFIKYRNGTSAGYRFILQLRLKRAIMDHAALIDRVTGSTTLVVHIPGSLEPGTPALAEHIKANAYIPGPVLREIERSEYGSNTVPEIVQTIIREIGVPTVRRFDRARAKLWKFPRWGGAPIPRPLPEINGMPHPIPDDSSRYTFYGKRLRVLPSPDEYFRGDSESEEDDYFSQVRKIE